MAICESCRRCHSHCDGKLPCNRCLNGNNGANCRYLDRYVPGTWAGSGGNAVSTKTVSLAASRSLPSLSAQKLSNTKIRMKDADPTDTRKVFCVDCTKCHRTCDTMLPCSRCESTGKGHQCSYSKRYVPVEPDDAGVVSTNSAYSAHSPIISALLSDTKPNGSPSKLRYAQPITRDIFSDTETDDDENYADIMHEEETGDDETIEIAPSTGQTPSVRDSILSLLKRSENQRTSHNAHKRRASDSARLPRLGDFQQPAAKRARLGSIEAPWKPPGNAKKMPAGQDRPITRLSTSAVERRSYRSPTALPLPYAGQGNGEDDTDDAEKSRPENVPSTIREVFANMPEDIFLDVLPESCGPGRKPGNSPRRPTKASGPVQYERVGDQGPRKTRRHVRSRNPSCDAREIRPERQASSDESDPRKPAHAVGRPFRTPTGADQRGKREEIHAAAR